MAQGSLQNDYLLSQPEMMQQQVLIMHGQIELLLKGKKAMCRNYAHKYRTRVDYFEDNGTLLLIN